MKKNARMPESVESCHRNQGGGAPRMSPENPGCSQEVSRPLTFEVIPTLQARRSQVQAVIRDAIPDPSKP